MRFLLRLTFWLGIVAVLLPWTGAQPAPNAGVSATDAMSAAKATVGDMRQFCGRQPEACTVGSQAAVALGDRAKAGAKRIYEFFNERLARSNGDSVTTASTTAAGKAIPLPPARPSRHPLRPADLAPAWRGPSARPNLSNRRA